MGNKNLNLNGFTENEVKVIKRLVLDFKEQEKNLKFFDAEEMVNMFIHSEFYSNRLTYPNMFKRCKEYMIDEYPNV